MNKNILDIISDETRFNDIPQELLKTQSIIGYNDEISKDYCYKVTTSRIASTWWCDKINKKRKIKIKRHKFNLQ